MDVDGLLWLLALDVSLINCDGYWIRASDYSIYLDDKGRFHVIPHDMNEGFRPPQGPGMGGPGGPRMMMARPGEVLPVPLQDMLGLTAEQKKQLDELQKEAAGRLEKILTNEQNKQVKEMRDRGPGGFGPPPGFGPPGGAPPGGPGGFGPPGGGPGSFGPPGGGIGPVNGVELDPLVTVTDPRKPLRNKVLAVPGLRAKYLANVRTIAEKSLDWKTLGPVVAQYRKLIDHEVETDTRKLETYESFRKVTANEPEAAGGRGREMSLRAFADQRRKYLLAYKPAEPGPAKAGPDR
jgi:hypothetical protein